MLNSRVHTACAVQVVIEFMKLLFGEWRAVIKMDCWQLGGFCEPSIVLASDLLRRHLTFLTAGADGKMWMNLAVMPVAIAGVCFVIFLAQRKTLLVVIEAGAADQSALDTLRVKLIHNLFLAIFLV